MFKDPFSGAQVPVRVRIEDRPDAAQGCKQRNCRDHAGQEQRPGTARWSGLTGGTVLGHAPENG